MRDPVAHPYTSPWQGDPTAFHSPYQPFCNSTQGDTTVAPPTVNTNQPSYHLAGNIVALHPTNHDSYPLPERSRGAISSRITQALLSANKPSFSLTGRFLVISPWKSIFPTPNRAIPCHITLQINLPIPWQGDLMSYHFTNQPPNPLTGRSHVLPSCKSTFLTPGSTIPVSVYLHSTKPKSCTPFNWPKIIYIKNYQYLKMNRGWLVRVKYSLYALSQ